MSREFSEEGSISRYDDIYNDFFNLAITRFQWENLPIGITSEILETMLITRGQVLCFKRENGGLTILPCDGSGTMDLYGQYNKYNVHGSNGFTDVIEIEKSVRIKNNPLSSNNINNLVAYSKRIDDVEMTQDVNLFQQNIPKIILSEENGRLTAKNLINELRKFKFVIFGKKTLSSQLSKSDVLDTTSPFLLDKLQDHKNNLINEVLTSMSINNNNADKKERQIVDEVNANNELIQINLDLMYDMRIQACKEIKAMFKSNIKVSKREVKVDGQIHNDDNGNDRE